MLNKNIANKWNWNWQTEKNSIDKQRFVYGDIVKFDKPRVSRCLHCNVDVLDISFVQRNFPKCDRGNEEHQQQLEVCVANTAGLVVLYTIDTNILTNRLSHLKLDRKYEAKGYFLSFSCETNHLLMIASKRYKIADDLFIF